MQIDWAQSEGVGDYDVYVSGYNPSDRVEALFRAVRSKRKVWAVQGEYGLKKHEWPTEGDIFESAADDEIEFGRGLVEMLGGEALRGLRMCLDLTGLIHPNMMYLLRLLARMGVRSIDCLYSEPVSYLKREETSFAIGGVLDVRQIAGFEGSMNSDISNDLLVIGAGYDEHLLSEVAQHKDYAKKVILLGFPSLRADMYQQNLVRMSRAEDVLRPVPARRRFFSPANDPFVTASVLNEIVEGGTGMSEISNLYLAPLATKAQALGFVIYFLDHMGQNANLSVLFPYSDIYEKITDFGISRAWRYVVELPNG